jgi:hypothetical protein
MTRSLWSRLVFLRTTWLLGGSVAISAILPAAHRAFGGDVPPLFASFRPSIGIGIVVPIGLIALAWWGSRRLADAPTWVFLAALVAFTWVFAVSLAVNAAGASALRAPFENSLDYWVNVPLADELGPRVFAERYAELSSQLSAHARVHPPGAVLLLWSVARITGGSLTAVAAVTSLLGALVAVPTYAIATEFAGPRAARHAAILVAASPGVLLFAATSMDAVFMTVLAGAFVCVVRAPRSAGWAAAGGAAIAVGALFTFAALALGLVGIGAGLRWMSLRRDDPHRRRRVLIRAAVALGAFVATVWLMRAVLGADLVATFRSATEAHLADPSRDRSAIYWVVGNIAAFLISAGIPLATLLIEGTRDALRRRLPSMAAILWGVVLVMTISGLFRGEVDHIWLFLVPLVAVEAGTRLAERTRSAAHGILAVAVVLALSQAVGIQLLLDTHW